MDKNIKYLNFEEPGKPINWRDLFDKVLFHWKCFAVSGALTLILGFFYIRSQQDIYELRSSVLIIDQNKSGQLSETSLLNELNGGSLLSSSSSRINNEIEVLKSYLLVMRVVNKLELYTDYSQTKFLKTTDLYKSSPLYVNLDSASLYKLKASLNIKIKPINHGGYVVHCSYPTADGEKTYEQEVKSLPVLLNTPFGYISILQKNDSKTPTEQINVKISNPEAVAMSYRNGILNAEAAKLVDVIELSVKVTNPEKGKDFLNTLAEIYNADATEQNNLSANNTAIFIDSRLKFLADELSGVETLVENYKQSNNVTNLDEDTKIILENSNVYNKKQIDLQIQQNLVKFVDDFVQNPKNLYSVIPDLGLTDQTLTQIIGNYNDLVINRERIATATGDNNPTLKIINQQIAASRKAIITSISNGRKGLQITNQDLMSENTQLKTKIKNVPKQEREMMEILRQQQVKASLYLFLLQKREEASLNMAVTTPKARVLNIPNSPRHIAPRIYMLLLVLTLIALIVPAAILYLSEALNTKVRTREDVERKTKIPVLSELAHNNTSKDIIDFQVSSEVNQELFRLLRTKLQFVLNTPDDKVILVTSNNAGEGKTYVSLNLAISLSLSDKKVLLMGMDLRKPKLRKLFDIENENGISAYLSGQSTDYKSLLYSPDGLPNLHVLHAGIVPPNPSELIMKSNFDALIQELKRDYDYIVIDSAPVGLVSDSFLINRVANISLFICRAGVSDVRQIENANRIEQEKSLNRMFIIINDVDVESSRYAYNNRYSLGYKYGYKTTTGKKSKVHKSAKKTSVNTLN
ncbi:MAG: capsular exopolysaccharide family [Bacteroidetes bacterium]|nr:capsular exopolysaccharide family [Bacteroidota bacterium]